MQKKHGPNWLVVLLIDELDAATTTLPDSRSFELLRSLVMTSAYAPHFRVVATGVAGLTRLTAGEGSVLSNLEGHYLRVLSPDQARKLISANLELAPALEARVLELTGGHPYLLQALLGALWDLREDPLTEVHVMRAAQKVISDRFGTFRQWLTGFGESGCAVYQALAEAGDTLAVEALQRKLRLGPGVVPEALHVLRFHGAVDDDNPAQPRIVARMFREWFQAEYSNEKRALPEENPAKDRSKSVFVVHGRNSKIRTSMFTFLRSIGLKPLEWTEIKEKAESLNPYIGAILEAGFAEAQAVVVLLTGDDEARLRAEFRSTHDTRDEVELRPQPRPNVLFEAGMAMAKFPKATVLVQVGEIRGMSDIFGRHLLRMDDSLARRTELAKSLKRAGCAVDIESQTDWQTAGTFSTSRV